MKQKKSFEFIIIHIVNPIIILILIDILIGLIYMLIWHFIYQYGNDTVIGIGAIICYLIGWRAIDEIASENYYFIIYLNEFRKRKRRLSSLNNRARTLTKLLLAPIGIPLWLMFLITKTAIVAFMEKYVEKEKVSNTTKHNEVISCIKDINQDEQHEYYCEICDCKISEEEYVENGEMCEDCFIEFYFNDELRDMYK